MFGVIRRWRAHDAGQQTPARKVFGIGFNKTGTSSLALALQQLGYRVAPQPPIVRFFESIIVRKQYRELFEFCMHYDAFQDIPFSMPGIFRVLDRQFPGAKFVLTVRTSAAEWYDSLFRFTAQLYRERHGQLPTFEVMRVYPVGTDFIIYKLHRFVFEAEKYGLWNRAHYQSVYERHNAAIRKCFRRRAADFLEIHVGATNALARLCRFLGHPVAQEQLPHANRSA